MKSMEYDSLADNIPKSKLYKLLKIQLTGLLDAVPYTIANLGNASALLNRAMKEINWVGFYLRKGDQLVLGPFQGKPACVTIPIGKGVCGTAVLMDETLLIPDVHEFPGHIACDCDSKSEIVIPIHVAGEVVGVLDIDSPYTHRFDQDDQEGLERLVRVLEEAWNVEEV